MPLRAVILDIGGVLEITPSTGWQRRWEARLDLREGQIDERLHDIYRRGSVGAITLAEAERQIAAALDLDAYELEALMADLWDEYLGSLDTLLTKWFAALRPRFKTGILSNSWVGAREREHARYGFGDLCDTIVYSHEEGVEKPHPRAYDVVCSRLGVKPEEAVFLDDMKVNVAAARALGMQAVLFRGDASEAIAEIDELLGRANPG